VAGVRFLVRGVVQGVGYRYFARSSGRALRLRGWVRNVNDGSVELVVDGPPPALDRLEAKLREGPPGARVESVSRSEAQVDGELPDPFIVLR
jgi:acylphosphatase